MQVLEYPLPPQLPRGGWAVASLGAGLARLGLEFLVERQIPVGPALWCGSCARVCVPVDACPEGLGGGAVRFRSEPDLRCQCLSRGRVWSWPFGSVTALTDARWLHHAVHAVRAHGGRDG